MTKYNPNRFEIAKCLVQNGVDINYRDRNGTGESALSATIMPNFYPKDFDEENYQFEFFIYLVKNGVT